MDIDQDGKLSFEDVSGTLMKYFGGKSDIYRMIWDTHVTGDKEFLTQKDFRDIFAEYPEYALLYQIEFKLEI